MSDRHLSPVIALAFAEDALALASYIEAHGFPEDAARCRELAAKLRASIPQSRRWEGRVTA